MKLIAFALAVITAFASFGIDYAESVEVCFRAGHRQYDSSLDDNGDEMERFVEAVRKAEALGRLDRIVVNAYAPLDGTSKASRQLWVNRCEAIADYIAQHTGVSRARIELQPRGIAWAELRQLVADTPEVPSREDILEIIDNTPVLVFNSAGQVIDSRKKQLTDLGGGVPYRWMYEHLFPQLRNRAVLTLRTNSGEATRTFMDGQTGAESAGDDSVGSSLSADWLEMPEEQPVANPFYSSLKTNMLFDALLVPNLGAEFYLGKGLSLYGEWMYGWWDNNRRHRYWRIYGGDLTLRWWFGKKAHAKPLTGHHVGVYGGALIFDFEFGDKGYMGGKPGGTLWDRCLVNAGIEYGYSLPVGKRLNIDFSIGFGYFGGNYIEYFPFDNDYYRKKEYNLRFFGPTKAEISLVWLIGRGNRNSRKGGGR